MIEIERRAERRRRKNTQTTADPPAAVPGMPQTIGSETLPGHRGTFWRKIVQGRPSRKWTAISVGTFFTLFHFDCTSVSYRSVFPLVCDVVHAGVCMCVCVFGCACLRLLARFLKHSAAWASVLLSFSLTVCLLGARSTWDGETRCSLTTFSRPTPLRRQSSHRTRTSSSSKADICQCTDKKPYFSSGVTQGWKALIASDALLFFGCDRHAEQITTGPHLRPS